MESTTETETKPNRLPKVFFARFLLIALGYGINGAIITGIPFLFYHAPINCLDASGASFSCSKAEACENPYGYIEGTEYPQISSIPSLLNFHCDRRVIEATIQTIGQFGRSFGYVILLFFPVPVHRKETLIYTLLLISGLSLISLSVFNSTEMFGFSLLTSNLMFSLFYGLMYSYISDSNPTWFSKMGAAYANTAWPIIMIFMIIFCYFFGSWQNILIHFTGIPLALIGVSGFLLRRYIAGNSECQAYIRDEIDCEKQRRKSGGTEKTSFELLKMNYTAMRDDKVLRKNVMIWTLGWACNGLCFFGCYISLNTLKGDLYFNNMSSTLFELFSSLLAVVIVQKLDLRKVITNTYLIIGICFCSCVFKSNTATGSSDGLSDFGLFIELLPVIIAKISYEMMWTVMVQYTAKVVQRKYHQVQFTFSSTVGMAITNFIPFYNYLMETLGFSPFIGYGLFCLAAAYFSKQFVELEDDIEGVISTGKKTIEHPLLDVELDMLQTTIKSGKKSNFSQGNK